MAFEIFARRRSRLSRRGSGARRAARRDQRAGSTRGGCRVDWHRPRRVSSATPASRSHGRRRGSSSATARPSLANPTPRSVHCSPATRATQARAPSGRRGRVPDDGCRGWRPRAGRRAGVQPARRPGERRGHVLHPGDAAGARAAAHAARSVCTRRRIRPSPSPCWTRRARRSHAGSRDIAAALEQVQLPGRFQRYGSVHLRCGAQSRWRGGARGDDARGNRPPAPVVALLAVLADKDWRGMMEQLAPVVSRFVLTTAPTAPASRRGIRAAAAAFAECAGVASRGGERFRPSRSSARPSSAATVLVTGSFHTVGDAMARLQASPAAG